MVVFILKMGSKIFMIMNMIMVLIRINIKGLISCIMIFNLCLIFWFIWLVILIRILLSEFDFLVMWIIVMIWGGISLFVESGLESVLFDVMLFVEVRMIFFNNMFFVEVLLICNDCKSGILFCKSVFRIL